MLADSILLSDSKDWTPESLKILFLKGTVLPSSKNLSFSVIDSDKCSSVCQFYILRTGGDECMHEILADICLAVDNSKAIKVNFDLAHCTDASSLEISVLSEEETNTGKTTFYSIPLCPDKKVGSL